MARDGQHQANLRISSDLKQPNAELQALAKRMHDSERQVDRLGTAMQRTGRSTDAASKSLSGIVASAQRSVVAAKAASKAWELEKVLARGRNAVENQKRALEAFDKAQRRVAAGAETQASAFGLATKAIGGAAGFSFVAGQAMQAANELADRGQRVANVFGNLKMPIGAARDATSGLISDFELAKFANMSMALGIESNSKKFAELTESAVKLGARINQDATQSVESLMVAVGRGSTEMLDNLGVVLKVEEAHRIYAKQLGITAAQLTEVQKAEAFKKVAIEKVIEAAKDVTLETENAASAVKRFGIELDNIRDRALGAETPTVSLKTAISQMTAEQRSLINTSKVYGSDAKELRRVVMDLGVSWDGASVSLEDYGKALRSVTMDERRLRQEQLLSGDLLKQAQKATAQSVIALYREANKVRLREIEEEKARYANETKMREYLLDLGREETEIKASQLALDGKLAEAEELRHQQRLKDLREESSARERLDKVKSDPTAPFKGLLIQAENMKRLREFGDRLNQVYRDEIAAQEERELRLLELKEGSNAKVLELDTIRLEHQRRLAEIRGADEDKLVELDMRRMRAEERRAEASRKEVEAEIQLKQVYAERLGDREALATLAIQKDQIDHERRLGMLRQQMAAEEAFTEKQAVEAKKRQATQKRNQAEMLAMGEAAAGAALQIAGAARHAAQEARKAGLDEANARRVAAGEALIAISRRLAGQAIAAGVEAAAAFASYRYGEGVRQLAVAGIYGGGAIALGITGRKLVASGRGAGSVGGSGSSAGTGVAVSKPPPETSRSGGRGDGKEVPASDIRFGTSDRNSPQDEPRTGQSTTRGGTTIQINAKVIDKALIREIFKQANEMNRTEGLEGVPSRKTGT